MAADLGAVCPTVLLDQVRRAAGTRSLLLIADHTPNPPPQKPIIQASSTQALDFRSNLPKHAVGLVVTAWVTAQHCDGVIARLRDLLTDELYVVHTGAHAQQTRQMGELGLRCQRVLEQDGTCWGLHHYSLRTYKKTPRWLNSRYWANPQRWNQTRW